MLVITIGYLAISSGDNSELYQQVRNLSKDEVKNLVETVVEAADDGGVMPRRQLFFEMEPFAREFGEYYVNAPEPDAEGKSLSRALSHLKRMGEYKYRATFYAWLSYYHPDRASIFADSVNVSLPSYRGHPIADEDWSQDARDHFVNQKRFPTTILIGIALLAAVGLAVSALVLWPQFWETEYAQSPPIDSQTNPESAIDSEELTPPENEEAPETGIDELEGEAEIVQETRPGRNVNPVWKQISAQAWSVQPLPSFRSRAIRANRLDLIEAARAGNRNAQALAGMGYHLGSFGEVNHRLALTEYLRPACESGHGRACALVGAFYGQGDMGVPQNHQTARSYYSQACRLGNQMGCYLESTRLISGFVGEQDVDRGYTQLRRACDSGVRDACWYGAQAYASGWNTAQDVAQSRRYYSQARQLGHPQAQAPFDEWFVQSGYDQR